MFDSILIVCVGNICRSPIGERLFSMQLPGKNISSAGIKAVVGAGADKMAQLVAEEHGLSLKGHVARQLTADICRSHDLILVMERAHIEAVSHINPESRGKVMLLGHWVNQQEIADPFRTSREYFEAVYTLIASSTQKWVEKLSF